MFPLKEEIVSVQSKLLIPLSLLALLLFACNNQSAAISQNDLQVESQQHLATEEEHHDGPSKNEHNEETIELSAIALGEGEKLKVVATTNILGDLVHNVGGDKIALTTLLPIGADPHTFAPTPQDIAAIADAHLVFINGLGLEEFLETLIANAGSKVPVVALSANVETRKFEETGGEVHNEEEHDAEDHAHSGADPHIWLSPANALMVQNIENALHELDLANAKAYKANAESYNGQLAELDSWVMAQINTVLPEHRKMVTDHDAFGYYADRYGLEIIGTIIPAYSTNAEPSAQAIAHPQETINVTNAGAIFVGSTTNPALSQRISEDTGIKLVPLYTGSLSEASQGVATYLNLIRYNTTAIVEALKAPY